MQLIDRPRNAFPPSCSVATTTARCWARLALAAESSRGRWRLRAIGGAARRRRTAHRHADVPQLVACGVLALHQRIVAPSKGKMHADRHSFASETSRRVAKESRSQPVSRVLLRRGRYHPRYDRHSSRPGVAARLEPPTRGLCEQPQLLVVRLLGVAPDGGCRVSPASRFDRGSDSSLWPCSSPSSAARAATYSGRALPGILLCGARTFLSPLRFAPVGQRRSWLASDRVG